MSKNPLFLLNVKIGLKKKKFSCMPGVITKHQLFDKYERDCTFSCNVQVALYILPWRAVPSVSARPGSAAEPQCLSWHPHCGRQPCTLRGARFWSRGRPAWWFPGTRPSDSETESPALTAWRASWRTASDLLRGRMYLLSFTYIDFHIYMVARQRFTAETTDNDNIIFC